MRLYISKRNKKRRAMWKKMSSLQRNREVLQVANKERYKENKEEYQKGGKYYKYVTEAKKAQIQKIQEKDIPFVPQETNTIRYHDGKLYIETISRIEIPVTKEQLEQIRNTIS